MSPDPRTVTITLCFMTFSPVVVAVAAGAVDEETAVWPAQAEPLPGRVAPSASTLAWVRNFRLSIQNSLLRNSRKENFLKNCHHNLSAAGHITSPKADIVHCCPCCIYPLHFNLLQVKQKRLSAKKSFLLYRQVCVRSENSPCPKLSSKNFLNLSKLWVFRWVSKVKYKNFIYYFNMLYYV